MAKYMVKERFVKNHTIYEVGEIFELIKLPKPVDKYKEKCHYVFERDGFHRFFTKQDVRKCFAKVRKSNPFIRNLLIIAAWELGKYLGEQLIIYANRNDEVEAPSDFNIDDRVHLNNIKAEVSE